MDYADDSTAVEVLSLTEDRRRVRDESDDSGEDSVRVKPYGHAGKARRILAPVTGLPVRDQRLL